MTPRWAPFATNWKGWGKDKVTDIKEPIKYCLKTEAKGNVNHKCQWLKNELNYLR